jgi:hypothetical protein
MRRKSRMNKRRGTLTRRRRNREKVKRKHDNLELKKGEVVKARWSQQRCQVAF